MAVRKIKTKKPVICNIAIIDDGNKKTESVAEEKASKSYKKKSILLTIVALFTLLAVLPWSRYAIAGLFYKKIFSIEVLDAATNDPVSGALVKTGNLSTTTDSGGNARLHLSVGQHKFILSKKYYRDRELNLVVSILKKNNSPFTLSATGRQVKISVKNLINRTPLADVDIKIADTSAKTGKNGNAIVALPAGATSEKATLNLSGYNNATDTVELSNSSIKENDFNLTPAGKVYFLSKLSGKIAIVKTNLDGSDRQTVLAGTGKEDDRSTVLLASRDWRYLALLSNRDGNAAKLYIITTADDSLTTIDGDSSTAITMVGWGLHNFVYTTNKQNFGNWQPNKQEIKSYDASAHKNIVLAQTNASGTNTSDYLRQSITGVYTYCDIVVYSLNWSGGFSSLSQLNNKQATFNRINVDGTKSKTIKSFAVDSAAQISGVSLNFRVHSPGAIYVSFVSGTGTHYYSYDTDEAEFKEESSLTYDKFWTIDYPTYIQSPGRNAAFWSDARGGEHALLLGSDDGYHGKQIATLSQYQPYGWYANNYLLVSKNSSELYIMSKSGISKDSEAIKITDYHKSAQNFYVDGGGYGGV